MKKLILLLAAAFAAGPFGARAARAQDDTLTVVQDESSMERRIEQFLKTRHQLTVNEKFNGDDLWLELPFKGDPMPKYRVLIDTQPLNKDDNGRVTERGIRVQLLTGIKVPAVRWAAMLQVINDFNRKKVFSAAYIDTDGEVILDWTLNVMAQGLDVEYTYDMLAREDKLWRELYPLVSATLQ